MRFRRIEDGVAICQRRCQRLLDQDMNAGLGGFDGVNGVQRVGSANRQGLDAFTVNHLLNVAIGFDIVDGGESLGPRQVSAAGGDENGLRRAAEGFGVQVSNFSAPHDGGFKRFHVCFLLLTMQDDFQ